MWILDIERDLETEQSTEELLLNAEIVYSLSARFDVF